MVRCWTSFHSFLISSVSVVLGTNSGGVLNTQPTGLRSLSRVLLAGDYTTRSVLLHDFIHVTAVNATDPNILFHSYSDYLRDMVTSILLMFIYRGLNMAYHSCSFFIS